MKVTLHFVVNNGIALRLPYPGSAQTPVRSQPHEIRFHFRPLAYPRAGEIARSADRFEKFYAYEVNVARFLLPLYARLNRGHTGRNQG
jgi:hypothetical protein